MKKIYLFAITALLSITAATAQDISFGHAQNRMKRNKDGINQFDVRKDSVKFEGLSAYIGGAFAMSFQGLNSFNGQAGGTQPANADGTKAYSGYQLTNLENQFNLPMANFAIGAQLADGVRVHLDVYLATRHHNDTWVQGGYLQVDKLDFIKKDFLSDVMKYTTIKVGQMENNYGDAHFRRSNAGDALRNSFIEGNIMDSFQTDMGMEVYYNRSGWVSMLGVTNGKLNQSVAPTTTYIAPTLLAKFGYDKQLNKDLRVRLTGSWNYNSHMSSNPWSSDRGGSQYFGVMTQQGYTYNGNAVANTYAPTGSTPGDSNQTTGRYQPGYSGWYNAVMFNPYVKYKGLEWFSTIELTKGGTGTTAAGRDASRSVNQFVTDVVYRFGPAERFYVGARYGTVRGELEKIGTNASINRVEAAAGWYMTKNVVTKLAYVNQTYNDFGKLNAAGTALNDNYQGKFSGLMFQAAITF